MAVIGQQLIIPEAGWKRYDERDSRIKFSSPSALRQTYNAYGTYAGTLSYIDSGMGNTTDTISFKFTGSKLIIGAMYWNTNEHSGFSIEVDGVSLGNCVTGNKSAISGSTVAFIKTDFEDKEHSVVIKNLDKSVVNGSNSTFAIDFIDIDSIGRLLHPDEVTSIAELEIGKRIRCNYIATTSGVVGLLRGLGQETSSFIPSASSATPNGDFYFIMVEDWNGEKRLIADRNIQIGVSWNTLNSAGIASGSGLPFTMYGLDLTDTAGSSTSGGDLSAGYVSSNAFDNNNTSYWTSSQAGVDVIGRAWIGYEFPERKVIRKITINQFNGVSNMASSVKVQYSDDKVNWNEVGVYDLKLVTGIQMLELKEKHTGKYWRIVANSAFNTGQCWAIYEVEMMEAESLEGENAVIRLLTGGIASTDKDNEWDKYIVGSTLGGKIIAGDNSVWNWKDLYTTTSTTSTSGSDRRTVRGYSTNYTAASTASVGATGFRPMIVLQGEPPINKSLILSNGEYLKWVDPEWVPVAAQMPTEEEFNTHGMDDLFPLDRKVTTIERGMELQGDLGQGKVFKRSINLKKYKGITNISVK